MFESLANQYALLIIKKQEIKSSIEFAPIQNAKLNSGQNAEKRRAT